MRFRFMHHPLKLSKLSHFDLFLLFHTNSSALCEHINLHFQEAMAMLDDLDDDEPDIIQMDQQIPTKRGSLSC